MTTYQHGQQPDGAPVTWTKSETAYFVRDEITFGGKVLLLLATENHEQPEIEMLCRAFHLAKLAEEAAKIGEKASDMHDASCFVEPCNHLEKSFDNWLRRYREAVR